jgi:phosphatidylglycerophosphatase A
MSFRKLTVKSLSTFFGIGYLPFIPGTFGSIAGLLLFCLVRENPAGFTVVFFSLFIAGFLVCAEAEKVFQRKDAKYIVIDEVAGMFISLAFLPSYEIKIIVCAFFIFRLLDTFKPYPAGCFEKLEGSLGVMGDDIVAGLYTNLVLQVFFRLAAFKAS